MIAQEFRRLHAPGQLLVLANAWDAGSARLIESCGAAAIATTSAGVAWSHGYPDGSALPTRILVAAVAEIARGLSVPLTVDIEDGYSSDLMAVSELVAALVEAGAVGINIEDGAASPDLLARKISATKRAGVDLFVNARTDVYLRGLVPAERAAAETIERSRLYQDAGCDGLFVPCLSDPESIRRIADEIALPLNVMIVPGLAPVAELRALGVRRVSAGAALAETAYATARRAATELLSEGRYDAMFELTIAYQEMNALFVPKSD
jgi:2-methylisocitrate lyase-like PEP mutase family enzyme